MCRNTCKEVKHLNRLHDTEHISHLPSKPEEICAIDLYASLPTSHGGVRYLTVCHDVLRYVLKCAPLLYIGNKIFLYMLHDCYILVWFSVHV